MTKLIGTDTNQVPTNGDLGDLAYQNKESVRVDNLTIDSNVGIGTTAPGAELDVNGDIHADGISFDSGTNTLNYYETGEWTLGVNSDATGVISAEDGEYTRVGREVTLTGAFTVGTNFTSNTISGLPFTAANLISVSTVTENCSVLLDAADSVQAAVVAGTATMAFYNDGDSTSAHAPNTTNTTYRFKIKYIAS